MVDTREIHQAPLLRRIGELEEKIGKIQSRFRPVREQLRLANIDALQTEAEVNDLEDHNRLLREENDRLREWKLDASMSFEEITKEELARRLYVCQGSNRRFSEAIIALRAHLAKPWDEPGAEPCTLCSWMDGIPAKYCPKCFGARSKP